MTTSILKGSKAGSLRVQINGDLDMRTTYGLLQADRFVDQNVSSCIIDLSEVRRVFDSGIALLTWFIDYLKRSSVKVSIIGNDADPRLLWVIRSDADSRLVIANRPRNPSRGVAA